jgi:hypothetical protein
LAWPKVSDFLATVSMQIPSILTALRAQSERGREIYLGPKRMYVINFNANSNYMKKVNIIVFYSYD